MPITLDGTTGINTPAISAGNIVGEVAFFALNTPPAGWLKANGDAVSRTTYAALFAAIGTTFGSGNGSTTFNLPDMRGEFPRGWSDGRNVDSGRAFGSAQSDDIKAHTHTVAAGNSAGASNIITTGNGRSNDSTFTTSSAGNAETRPRNIALLACIKF